MAAAEGVSRKVKLIGITDFMEDSQPLFFPYGEQVTSSVQLEQELHYFIIEPSTYRKSAACHSVWSGLRLTTIGYEDFLASVQCLKSD
jgi:hypothetical protein